MLIAYLAGLVTLPAIAGLVLFLNWAFSRTMAYGECLACDHLAAHEIGDAYNVSEWLRGKWHDIWWSHRAWHRQSVKDYWKKYS